MGEFGANGIGGNPPQNEEQTTQNVDVLTEPKSTAPTNIEPIEILTDTIQNFAEIAADNPESATPMVNALTQEIFEAFNITEYNPGDINPDIATRVEALANAVLSNAEPQEIETAASNLFNGSIDNPERLNQLANYVMSQNGGHLAGLSVGGRNPWDEAQTKARREGERAMNVAVAAVASFEAAKMSAANIVADIWDRNQEQIMSAIAIANDTSRSMDDRVQGFADGTEQAYFEAMDTLRRRHPDLSDDEYHEILRNEFGDRFDDYIQNDEVLTAGLDELRQRDQARQAQLSFDQATTLRSAFDVMNGLSNDTSLENLQASLSATMSGQIGEINNILHDTRLAIDAEINRVSPNFDMIAQLREFEEQQQLKLDIMIDSYAYQDEVFDNLLAQGTELSEMSMSDIQEIIFNMPPELMQKVQQLQEMLPDENPMQFMDDLLVQFSEDNGYTPEQIAEAQQMVQEFGVILETKANAEAAAATAQAALAEASARQAELEAELMQALQRQLEEELANGGEILMASGPGDSFLSAVPNAAQEAYFLSQLSQEQRAEMEALQQIADEAQLEVLRSETLLEALKNGNTIEEAQALAAAVELPQPEISAPEETNVADAAPVNEEPAEQPWDRSQYSYLEDDAQALVQEILASSEPISVEHMEAMIRHHQLLGAYGEDSLLMVQAIMEETAPAYVFSDGPVPAHLIEQDIFDEIYNNIDLDSISKEDIMNMLADAGLSGEQLAASTEQIIADLQSDIGVDFVTGLNYPDPIEVSDLQGTPTPEIEEPDPPTTPENPTNTPQENDYAYNTGQPGGPGTVM